MRYRGIIIHNKYVKDKEQKVVKRKEMNRFRTYFFISFVQCSFNVEVVARIWNEIKEKIKEYFREHEECFHYTKEEDNLLFVDINRDSNSDIIDDLVAYDLVFEIKIDNHFEFVIFEQKEYIDQKMCY